MKQFYECGGCERCHPLGWDGDCRDDEHRWCWDRLEALGEQDVDWEIVPEFWFIYALRADEDGPVATALTYDDAQNWIALHAADYPDAEELYAESCDFNG